MDQLLFEYTKISHENSQLKFEIANLRGQVETYKNIAFIKKNSSIDYETKLKNQIEKEGIFFKKKNIIFSLKIKFCHKNLSKIEKILQKLDVDLLKLGQKPEEGSDFKNCQSHRGTSALENKPPLTRNYSPSVK